MYAKHLLTNARLLALFAGVGEARMLDDGKV